MQYYNMNIIIIQYKIIIMHACLFYPYSMKIPFGVGCSNEGSKSSIVETTDKSETT